MGFLSSLGGIINDQFGIGENTSHSLDVSDGIVRDPESSFGRLGQFAQKIDQSAERYYMEDGFIRDIRPRSRSIIFQKPDIYVVIKKRMFSTLADNSRTDLLEEKERILISASKRLFQNKCRLLAAYERLTKIEQMTVDTGRFNTFLAPQLFNLVDSTSELFSAFDIGGATKSAIDKLRKVMSYSEPGMFSNWTTNDFDAVFGSRLGEGPGTFELTNVASLSTTVSTDWGGGSASFVLEDPYNLLTVTEKDIDQALTDVTNPMRTGSFFKFTDIELQNLINDLKNELAVERRARQASNITFKVSSGSLLSKRVRAILDDEGIEIRFVYTNGIQDAASGIENADNFFDAFVSANSVFSTGSVQIEPQFLSGNEGVGLSENNQLTRSEREKFTQIIANIFTLIDQRQTSRRELKNRNAKINYARNRMRLFFNGKFIIQPLDTVTIWMNTNTDEDAHLPGGFTKQQNEPFGLDVVQRFDTIISNINNEIRSLRDPTGSFSKSLDIDDIERLSTVGPHVPKWLWRRFRQDITSQPTGPCIFSGLVGNETSGPKGSWSGGKWTITVPCEDTTGYFNKSQVNFKPSPEVFNSTIYDPFTPFDVSFDAATGVAVTDVNVGDFPPLLKENQALLQSGMLTFRSGGDRGSSVTEEKWKTPSQEFSFDTFRAVLHNPEGLVYRWKQGIQTLTRTNRPNPQVSIDQQRSVLLTNQPFAGQDVMNIISLLITAQPYNYGTFLKAAIANGNSIARKDELTNSSAAESYIQGLISDIEKNNLTWGNFVPYKKLVVNSSYERFIAEQRIDLVTLNGKLRQKLKEKAIAVDEMTLSLFGFDDANSAISINEQGQAAPRDPQSAVGAAADSNGQVTALGTYNFELSREIAALQGEFMNSVSGQVSNNQDIGLTLVGNDVIANPSLTGLDDAGLTPAQKDRDALQLRRRLHRNTARRFWQVRANDDNNLFIVDDQYDTNYDIQAFERALSGIASNNIFNSQYSKIGEQINSVKKLLGLECFANSQGHIEVRPPGYNKIPSTVFYNMFRERDETGVKVFPDFLESLYFNQIKSIINRLEVLEDEIRFRAVALGARNDGEIVNLIQTGNDNSLATNTTFKFLTDSETGTVVDLQSLPIQSNEDFADELRNNQLAPLNTFQTNISEATKSAFLFPPAVQASAVANFNPNLKPNENPDVLEPIRKRLRIKTGREPKRIDQLFVNQRFSRLPGGGAVSHIDRINLFDQIGALVSERHVILKSAMNAIKNLQEGVTINGPDTHSNSVNQGGLGNVFKPSGSSSTSTLATAPFLNRRSEIPQFLEHMIEFEEDDDIGFNSGRRFIITADRIISLEISENPPPYTMVTVNGLFGEGFISPPQTFQTSNDGNAITSAYAVDYDMWYQYGLRVSQAIEAPFLSDPDSQCAPFAVATLLEARENILRGSVEVAGYNEFYQPGDVVFIEDRNLLFYVKSVSHSFSYGKLSTTLQLTYGHSPGEYIPTMLDVAGKILYNAKGVGALHRNERFEMTGSARSIGAFVFDAGFSLTDDGEITRVPENGTLLESALAGRNGERNKDILSNTLFAVSGSLNQVSFRRQKSLIKLVYYKTGGSSDSEMKSLAEQIKGWLINPEGESVNGLQPLVLNNGITPNQKTFGINSEDVVIEEVDFTDTSKQTRRVVSPSNAATDPVSNSQGPSNAAVAVIRSIAPDSNANQMRLAMANSVIDIFIGYSLVTTQTSSDTGAVNEDAQGQAAAVNEARDRLLRSQGV